MNFSSVKATITQTEPFKVVNVALTNDDDQSVYIDGQKRGNLPTTTQTAVDRYIRLQTLASSETIISHLNTYNELKDMADIDFTV